MTQLWQKRLIILVRGDYFGNNSPNDKFNKELLPLLKNLGINKESDLDKIANLVPEIYEIGYDNGADVYVKEMGD